ncbi:hypothetical protein [Maribacter litoralis]|uniref:Uncharacterized protein n=1 Tax=Maribacter litoralis TaxID=2059726 RepID=A0A653LHS7_9FLAO|nr:hypothetical protein [Maribacter litoralis]VXA91485.1 conserved exported hypothetical protein [Maribacter litoralis]
MKATYFAFLILSVFLLNSCSSDENEIFVYEGMWSGQYVGNTDSGNWSIRIDINKSVIGTFTSIQSSNSYQIIGNISEKGILNATIGTSEIDGGFNGSFIDNYASGLWTSDTEDDSGSWTGVKL